MMARQLPVIYCQLVLAQLSLQLWEENRKIELDSPAWFDWLQQERSFRFVYSSTQVFNLNLTIRPEKRGDRTYWQAWKTIRGQTTKKYLGPTAKLTRAKLERTAQWFINHHHLQSEIDPSIRFYAAAVDLVWLVEQLYPHCSQPALRQKAQQELSRIKRIIGN